MEEYLGGRHLGCQDVVAELAGTLARAGEGNQVVEQHDLLAVLLGEHLVVVDAVDAAVQSQPRRHAATGEFVLAVGVEQVELGFQRIGAVESGRAGLQVAQVGRRAEVAQRFAVEARQQAEARLDPALEHRALAAVGVEAPAAQRAQPVGLGPFLRLVVEAGILQMVEAEMRRFIVAEQARPFRGIVFAIEQREQVGVEFGDAVECQRRRMALEGQAAEDHRGQVAAVDRQARPGGQGGGRIVATATKAGGGVVLCRYRPFSS